jgi:hypothetical protein
MRKRLTRKLPLALVMLLSACGLVRCAPEPLDLAEVDALYADPLPPSEGPLSVYFMGHSLIGRDMPAMLAQLAGAGHTYDGQLGWGAELQAHWGDIELAGGDEENAHPRFREAHEAVESGDYDALVLTEKITIAVTNEYHDSWHYLALWAEKAAAANPDIRLYIMETWIEIEDEDAWLAHVEADLSASWERDFIDRALATGKIDRPVYIIPGGQVMARFVRALRARGGVDGLTGLGDLFRDNVHFNTTGAYLMALTHYAVLYGRSPVGLPTDLTDETGQPIPPIGPEAARLMQETVWEVVQGYKRSGRSAS